LLTCVTDGPTPVTRLTSLVEEGKVDLGQCSFFILDEADKLLEMGFLEQVDGLLAAANHPGVTRALFRCARCQGFRTLMVMGCCQYTNLGVRIGYALFGVAGFGFGWEEGAR